LLIKKIKKNVFVENLLQMEQLPNEANKHLVWQMCNCLLAVENKYDNTSGLAHNF
jgi:hypothetical protein